METIWCLFSIANEYDQPDNNLECVWLTKPTFKQIRYIFGLAEGKWIEDLLEGLKVRDAGHTEYRLKEIELNRIL
ncbi:hypothetical protein [uncultured Clostridium sp.]|uniref:hypothetical protein n=1 Tax=uncultured Clostridium sp. TaxID=59620 RepID=UPI00261F3829|nr:hypothetical protein [uncultured Clostridium sp.]